MGTEDEAVNLNQYNYMFSMTHTLNRIEQQIVFMKHYVSKVDVTQQHKYGPVIP